MASCNPIEVFSFGSPGGEVVSTTGDTGSSSLTVSGERGSHEAAGGSGEVEFPGVGSCECSSVNWASIIGAATGLGVQPNSGLLNLHHMRTCTGTASRPSAQLS